MTSLGNDRIRAEAIAVLNATDSEMAFPQHEKERRSALYALIATAYTSELWQETAARICYEQHYDCLSDALAEHFLAACPDRDLAVRALSVALEEFGLAQPRRAPVQPVRATPEIRRRKIGASA